MKEWRDALHFGYEANKNLWYLQMLNPPADNVMDGTWRCGKCERLVSDGYLCPCQKLNKDDLRYAKDKEDAKFRF